MKVKNEERIARLEAICDKMRSEELDVQKKAYEDACAAEDEDLAAALARIIRNRYLASSDSQVAFDRFGIELPDTITATSMLKALKDFFEGLKQLLKGDWAAYRQALRDLPEQAGFPFNITWPDAPDAEQADDE